MKEIWSLDKLERSEAISYQELRRSTAMPYFACPKCGTKMYSAYDHRECEIVVCASCNSQFANPHFRPTPEHKATATKQAEEDAESE